MRSGLGCKSGHLEPRGRRNIREAFQARVSGYSCRMSTSRGLVVVLFLIAAVLAVAGCGESARDPEVITNDAGPAPGATEPGVKSTTTPPSTDGQEGPSEEAGSDTAGGPDPDPTKGEAIFATAGCGSCHSLAAAGATGENAPNLDEAEPSFEEAVEQITNGGGGMPPFKDELTAREIEDVAAFVVESSKG